MMRGAGVQRDYYEPESMSVRFYDAITAVDPSAQGDVAFYLSLLGTPPKRCFVLGCGTGRVALAMAAKGHFVVGIDTSQAMLTRAELNRRRLPAHQAQQIRFFPGDMTTFTQPLWFNLAVAPFYAFNHLPDRRQRALALANMAQHLAPGGRAALHVLTPLALRTPRREPPPRPGLVLTFEHDGSRLEVTWSRRIIEDRLRRTTQLVEYQLFAADGSLCEAAEERLTCHWFEEREIERAAAAAGLGQVTVHPGFGPDPDKERVYVFEKQRA